MNERTDWLDEGAEPIRRPGPLRWLLYALGMGLPAAHRGWVLFDVTTRTWMLRHLARTIVQIIPFAVVLYVVIPGPTWVRLAAIGVGAVMGLFWSSVYIYETNEHRAVKAGYPVGYAAAVRDDLRSAERRRRERGG
ncbi:DUF5313 family protein [Pseudonocardia benzenivorans]|uniref:DUF5313 domain-containing protein n=2 Tax=Pseudonocardia TaxID=1847 RepID=F4CRN8_PSEUX|nr:DUF5313 family protein [Pseudonocardia dioxanivorans]AEA26246.1 hypothetical protein Psed_4083 [Pseudonocardia dioxanivorans CB1190]GJF03279.1 hypothetical protein PSD17_22390 [Pseudonocardia sp. D17]